MAPSDVRRLLAHAGPHRLPLAGGAVLAVVGGAVGLAQPMAARSFVASAASGKSVLEPVLLLGALVLGGAVLGATGAYLVQRCAESVVLRARRDLVSRIVRLRVGAVDRQRPGDLIARVTADTLLLREAATGNLVDIITGGFTLLGMLALMAYLDLVLFLVVLGVAALVGSSFALLLPKIGEASQETQAALGELGAGLERVLGAFRTVKANGAEDRELATLHGAAREAWRRGVRAARWGALAGVSSSLVVQVSFLTVLGVGGARVAAGALPVASLVAFLLYLFYLVGPVNQLVSGISGVQVGSAAVRRIEEIAALDGEPAPTAPGTGRSGGGGASVTFKDVRFRYDADGPRVLDGVSFDVPANGLTAIVGPSGAGKSTLFSVLVRFFDVESGTVAIDGRDLREWPRSELRGMIGYVEQNTPVLAGTLRDNLLIAAPDAGPGDIARATAKARLDSLVRELPEGLDTPVGPHGVTLSGGQRQRIAIARALLRDPRLLLLDEATSQLDAVNELELRDTIAEIARTTTVLAVAHRLSTVVQAQRILLFEDGRLRGAGTHAQLLESDDLYRVLAETQLLHEGRP